MSLEFKSRYKPEKIREDLSEVNIKPGDTVLDFGCGPGGYSFWIAKAVGNGGKVYALDSHPSAEKMVKKQIRKSKVTNLHFIRSNCDTGLMDKSVDVILLFDVFHELGEPLKVLKELHRVLKDEGILSFSDHHLEHDEIMDEIAGSSLFKLANKREDHYIFSKVV